MNNQNNNFNNFLKQKGQKENPITNAKPSQQSYKSVRIYPDDFKEYKRISFNQDKPIVELISEALTLLKQKYDD